MNCPFCKTRLDKHEAGNCLDAWLHRLMYPGDKVKRFTGNYVAISAPPAPAQANRIDKFSTKISVAWSVIDHFEQLGYSIRLQKTDEQNKWWCYFSRHTNHGIAQYGNTVKLAITKAAIAAMGDAKANA